MLLVISSILKGLIIKMPPSAKLHPENSDMITFDFSSFFSFFLTVINSRGAIHYPSLRVTISKQLDSDHNASLSVLLRVLF